MSVCKASAVSNRVAFLNILNDSNWMLNLRSNGRDVKDEIRHERSVGLAAAIDRKGTSQQCLAMRVCGDATHPPPCAYLSVTSVCMCVCVCRSSFHV